MQHTWKSERQQHCTSSVLSRAGEKHEGGRLDAEEKLRLSNSEAWEITPETPQPGRHRQNQGAIYGLGSVIGSDSQVTKNGQIKSIVRAGNHPRLSKVSISPGCGPKAGSSPGRGMQEVPQEVYNPQADTVLGVIKDS